jgi:hypothetical protein
MELYIAGLNQLREDREQGKLDGQVTELIQVKIVGSLHCSL